MRAVLGLHAVLIVVAITGAPALGQSGETAIIPGHSVGPVTLGMPAGAARVAAARFEQTTGCSIDLLVAHGAVTAAGSSWGGCLNLQLPSDTAAALMRLSTDPILTSTPFAVGTGGPPAILINAFGVPSLVRRGVHTVVLVFANGLVAHTGATHMRSGVVDYLAVQAPGARSIPRIGYLADGGNHARDAALGGGGIGDGLGTLPRPAHD